MNLQVVLEHRAKVEEFQRKHRIGLLTLLFTDLVGSTNLKQELGDREAVALIHRHHALVREILGRFKEGEEIGTAGDSFFIVFAKPSDAVQFSLMLQAGLRALAEEIGRPLLDRMGLHIGEVVIEERPDLAKPKDLYGLQVDICARVMSLAEGDQILMTRSAFDNARQVLKGQEIQGSNRLQGLQWLNHGPYLLKGVEEPLEICEVGEVGAAVLKPPADSEKVRRYVSGDAELVLGWRPALGQIIPGTQWELTEKLGEGGFGEVWLGAHPTLKERRVFKFCFRADRVRSLRREVTIFRLLKEKSGEHPNIVRLHDVFFDEPPFYIVTEFVPGRDLKSWCEMQGGIRRIPLETRLEIMAQIAEALQTAHDAGVIHRDIKPSNILISSPKREIQNPKSVQAKLADFGIGQIVSQEALAGITKLGFTQTILSSSSSAQSGTHLYMAPEVIAGNPASIRSDIYALGVVLYQMLTSDLSRPLPSDWPKDVIDLLLRDILGSCLAGDPRDRISNAEELARKLRTFETTRRALESKHKGERKGTSRKRVPSGLSLIIVIVLMPVLAWTTLVLHERLRFERALPGLIQRLDDPDWRVRQSYAEAIGRIRRASDKAGPALARALQDEEPLVRVAAANALRAIGVHMDEAVATLIDMLRDQRSQHSQHAAEALGKFGPARADVIQALVEALKSQDWKLRWQCIRTIGNIGQEAAVAVPALIQVLESADALNRQAAAEALRKIGTAAKDASPALSQALQDANLSVRRRAAESLRAIEPKALGAAMDSLLENLRSRDGQVRASAASALGSLAEIYDFSYEVEESGKIVSRHVNVGPVMTPALVKALEDETEAVRVASARALGVGWGLRADALASLIRSLRDPAPTVRAAAATALGGRTYYSSPPMGEYISSALAPLLKDENANVRCEAVACLKEFAGSRSEHLVPALTAALDDDIPFLREVAAETLGRIGPAAKAALPALTKTAKSELPRVRHHAIEAMRRIQE
ncbi:MAG: HEAT repeat domain-containing protein [Verrucomicrobia bacterium]|nr:HEAT repeat domain-containing protein [Verrucomicrobiota bacterium]